MRDPSDRAAAQVGAKPPRGELSDTEWAVFEPFVIERGPKCGRPPADHWRALDAVFWVARAGAPWNDLPEVNGRWSSVYKQFRRWTLSGLWNLHLEGLALSWVVPDTLQMIDSTIVRAHHCATGAKGALPTGSACPAHGVA